ncbi:hypothetical protein [Paenibacillus sp. FSL H8-0079]|uniref:hypothetical protein n=1 Tax=Paenibacillus sp. FSL H8-0079 TaxID=2921375 RepID=UPI0030EF3232
MKKRISTFFALILGISLLFSLTASANPAIVSYGGTYYNALSPDKGTPTFFLTPKRPVPA